MRFSTTIRLLVFCLIGVLALYFLDVSARARRKADAVSNLRTWTDDVAVVEVAFSNDEKRVFQLFEDGWGIEAPVSAPADDTQMHALLDAISGSTRIRRISSREMALRELTPADFGLERPQVSLTIKSKHGAEHSISFGAPPPASSNEVFVSVAGEDSISVIDTRALDFLSRPLVDFSDRRFCRANLRDVIRITVEHPGLEPFRLIRSQDRESWRMSSPYPLAADWGEMQKFMDAIAQARITSFLLDDDVAARTNDYVVIRLFSDKTPFPAVIAVGAETRDGTFSAMAEGDSRVTIPADTARSLLITPNSIRDRRVFASGPTIDVAAISITSTNSPPLELARTAAGDWAVTAPVAALADQDAISRLLSEILSLKANGFVSAPTNGAAIFVTIATPSTTNRLECLFEDDATITLDNSTTAARAPVSALATLRAMAGDSTLAVARRLGAFQLRDVLSIDITRDDGSSQRFDLAPDGSMSIGGDDASTEPISDAAEISTRIAAMTRFLASIEASAVIVPASVAKGADQAGADVRPPAPRITVTIEPRDPQIPSLTLRFSSPDPAADTVLATTSEAPLAPAFVFPASIYEIFARNFRESYHQAEPIAP